MPSTITIQTARGLSVPRALSSRGCTCSRMGSSMSTVASRAVRAGRRGSAGVAQLVERQPSKLNVASSNLVSRSVLFLGFGAPTPKPGVLLGFSRARQIFEASASTSGNRFGLARAGQGGGALASAPARELSGSRFGRCFAHLAQLVEHVLGKDEVTSSILVVGSKRLRPAAAVGQGRGAPYAVAAVGGGDGVTTESATN